SGHGFGAQGCVPLLTSLSITPGELTPAFEPTRTEYALRVAPWTDELRWLAVSPPSSSIDVAGHLLTSGAPALLPVATEASLLLSSGDATRQYNVSLRSEVRDQYLKASNMGTYDD